VVYSRVVEGSTHTFGISGRLYKSNVLLYDHQTETLWSQLLERGVAGPKAGKALKKIPAARVRWKTWKKQHPHTMVLSTDTGYRRDYSRDPYEGYYRVGTIWFPVGDVRKDLAPKVRILGVEINGAAKAYPVDLLRTRPGTVKDSVGGKPVWITVSDEGEITAVTDDQENAVLHIFSYWFAWQAFHNRTAVYR